MKRSSQFVALALLTLLAYRTAGAGEASAPPKPADASAEQSQEARFDIYEFQVDGNTVLPARDIEKLVYPFLGPGRSIADVEKAQSTLEQAYQEAGYPTVRVDIPEQNVTENTVRLQVVEATIDRTRITGSRYFSLGQIRAAVPALAEGRVPHMPTIQRELTELNKATPDRTVMPVARAGKTPGTTEWDLQVRDSLPLHGSLEMNSRNTAGTTYTRLSASVRYDNLWQKFHSIAMQFQTSPQDNEEVEVIAGTYVMPLFDTGWKLAAYGVGTNSRNFAAVLGGSTILGSGQIYGIRAVKPLPEFKDYFHTLTLGWDYKSFGQNLSSPVENSSTPVEYSPLSVRYDGNWKHDQGVTSFNIEANALFRGMGNDQRQFTTKRPLPTSDESVRPGGRTNYFYLGARLEHRQNLPYDIQAVALMDGQVATDMLINNEQFTAGGMGSVRGYHQVEILGDHGVSGSLELYSPKLALNDWDFVQELRALTFVDAARTSIIKPLNLQPDHYDLVSTGVGLKWQFWKHLIGEFYWAYPFTRTQNVNPGTQRIDFRLLLDY